MNDLVPRLPTDHFTVLCWCGIIVLVFLIFVWIAYMRDGSEMQKCFIRYFQDADNSSPDHVYCVSLCITEHYNREPGNIMYLRICGEGRQSPLVLFKDHGDDLLYPGQYLNIGVSVPFDLGNLRYIDVTGDNMNEEEGTPLFEVADFVVRKLKIANWALEPTESMFSNLRRTVNPESLVSRYWIAPETLHPTAQGIDVTGIETLEFGCSYPVMARSKSNSFEMVPEDKVLRRYKSNAFLPSHYLFSMFRKYHDYWSDFSRQDIVLVLCLDHLASVVISTTCYAFDLDKYIFPLALRQMIDREANDDGLSTFNMYNKSIFTPTWLQANTLHIVHIAAVSLFSTLLVFPMSLLWAHLYRYIGGKGFVRVIDNFKSRLTPSAAPMVSAGPPDPEDAGDGSGYSHLLLRTLECHSRQAPFCVTSSRRLRSELVITNCIADQVTARSVAYVRTKMTHLRDDGIDSGPRYITRPHVLNESHSESTDAPAIPILDEAGSVIRVARFCERIVQQAKEHVFDHSMIAECFELGNEKEEEVMCCKYQCCKTGRFMCESSQDVARKIRKERRAQKSFSNGTFLSTADAKSVKEMASSFSLKKALTPFPAAGSSGKDKNKSGQNVSDSESQLSLDSMMFCNTSSPKSKKPQQQRRGSSKTRSRLTGTSKFDSDSYDDISLTEDKVESGGAPQPSGGRAADVPFSRLHDDDDDRDGYQLTKVPVKGMRTKLFSFGLLVVIQLLELAFLTLVNQHWNRFYFKRDNPDSEAYETSAGKTHAAALSCCFNLIIYYLFTIHLYAFFTSCFHRFVDRFVDKDSGAKYDAV